MIIKESFLLNASNTDVLAAPSRLTSIPEAGVVTIEMSASDCDTTNYATATLQLPGGFSPFEDLHIPGSGVTTDGVLDNDREMAVAFQVDAGGHVLLSVTENGTVAAILIVVTLEF